MNNKTLFSSLLLGSALSAGYATRADSLNSNNIVLLSKDAHGATQEVTLTAEQYAQRLSGVLKSMGGSIHRSVKPTGEKKWKLKAVMVGVGFKVEFGLSHVLEMSVKPRFRLVYLPKGTSFFPSLD